MPRLEVERFLLGPSSQQSLAIQREEIELDQAEVMHEFKNVGSFKIIRRGQDAALVPQKDVSPNIRVFDETGKDWTGIPMMLFLYDISQYQLENENQRMTIRIIRHEKR